MYLIYIQVTIINWIATVIEMNVPVNVGSNLTN